MVDAKTISNYESDNSIDYFGNLDFSYINCNNLEFAVKDSIQ